MSELRDLLAATKEEEFNISKSLGRIRREQEKGKIPRQKIIPKKKPYTNKKYPKNLLVDE